MATELLLPKLGMGMEEGTISEWLVADGAQVEVGQPIYAVESDKSVQEIEAPATGALTIIAATGEALPVGTKIGEIG
ncbi:MAG: dihydrolipoamide acyltransferase [Sphingomonadaceae bacterium]|nr:dihydrolipoamide acyltransferase [Sphingomonadaceae bacterium]